MFKNLTVLKMDGDVDFAAVMDGNLVHSCFEHCGPTQEISTGWVAVRDDGDQFIETIDGQLFMRFAIETKSVPSQAVEKLVKEKIEREEAQSGRKVSSSQRKGFKDEARQELLPRAFPKIQYIPVWFDPADKLLYIGTATNALDHVVSAIVGATDMPVGLYDFETSPRVMMATWLDDAESLPENFELGESCELKAVEAPPRVRFDNHNLIRQDIREHIQSGKHPTKLELKWNDAISFTLKDTGQILKIDIKEKHKTDDDDHWAADVFNETAMLREMVNELYAAFRR